MLLRDADTTHKWTAVALRPLFRTSLKDNGEGKSSQGTELPAVNLVVHFAWKERNWEIGDEGIWGRGMWTDFSIWAKDVKTFVSHLSVHPKLTSAED